MEEGPMNHIFYYISITCDALGSVLMETLGPCIHMDVTLTCCSSFNIAADQLHQFTAAVFPNGSVLFQQHVPCHTEKKCSGMQRVQGVKLAAKFPRSQS